MEDRFPAAVVAMALYDAMPEDVQELNRYYGKIVDELFLCDYDAVMIKRELDVLRKKIPA